MSKKDTHDGTNATVTRRSVLRTSSSAIVGAGAVIAGSAAGSAGDKKDGCADPAWNVPRVTTRGHFDASDGVRLTDGNDAFNVEYAGDGIPGVHEPAADELLVFVHGWNNDEEGAVCTFGEAASTFEAEGYDEPVVGYSWDADHGWYDASEIAAANGAKLAAFTRAYADANSDVTVRYVAHSLGARVALAALTELRDRERFTDVASVSILGGAVDDDSVSTSGPYGEAIAAAAGRVDNFWMSDDATLNWAYGVVEWDDAIGNAGCEGTPPANYTDHEVDYVSGHSGYYRADGCVHEVVETF